MRAKVKNEPFTYLHEHLMRNALEYVGYEELIEGNDGT